jgi:hypothetical protein
MIVLRTASWVGTIIAVASCLTNAARAQEQVACSVSGPAPETDPERVQEITTWVTGVENNLGLPVPRTEDLCLKLQGFTSEWAHNVVRPQTMEEFFRAAVAHAINAQCEVLKAAHDKTRQFWVDTEAARAAACLAVIQPGTWSAPRAAAQQLSDKPQKVVDGYDPIPAAWNIKIDLLGFLPVGTEYCTQAGKCRFVGDELRFKIGDVIVRGPQGCGQNVDDPACVKARVPVQVLAASPAGSIIVRLNGTNYATGGPQWYKKQADGSYIGGPVTIIYKGVTTASMCVPKVNGWPTSLCARYTAKILPSASGAQAQTRLPLCDDHSWNDMSTGQIQCTDDMIERSRIAGFRAGAYCWILEQTLARSMSMPVVMCDDSEPNRVAAIIQFASDGQTYFEHAKQPTPWGDISNDLMGTCMPLQSDLETQLCRASGGLRKWCESTRKGTAATNCTEEWARQVEQRGESSSVAREAIANRIRICRANFAFCEQEMQRPAVITPSPALKEAAHDYCSAAKRFVESRGYAMVLCNESTGRYDRGGLAVFDKGGELWLVLGSDPDDIEGTSQFEACGHRFDDSFGAPCYRAKEIVTGVSAADHNQAARRFCDNLYRPNEEPQHPDEHISPSDPKSPALGELHRKARNEEYPTCLEKYSWKTDTAPVQEREPEPRSLVERPKQPLPQPRPRQSLFEQLFGTQR